MMEDSYGRTTSFDEFAEILADVLYKSETRSKQVKKALNGMYFVTVLIFGESCFTFTL